MSASRRLRIGASAAGCTIAAAGSASAALVQYTDEAEWQKATSGVTTIQFTEVPLYSAVNDQYAPLGVTFTPGDDFTFLNPSLWPSDGVGLNGGVSGMGFPLPIIMEFDQPRTSIAWRYPGITKCILYSGGSEVGSSSLLFGFDPWSFAGFISDVQFDKAVMESGAGANSMDTLFFGAPVPGPGGLPILMFGLCIGRRRRVSGG